MAIIELMSRNGKLLNFANHIFSEIGLGIESLEIKSDDVNELLKSNSKEFSNLKRMIENISSVKSGITAIKNNKMKFSFLKKKVSYILNNLYLSKLV